jgi:hypothetical protein
MFAIGDVVKLTGTVKDIVKGSVLLELAVPDSPQPVPKEYWASEDYVQTDSTIVAGATPGTLSAAAPPPPAAAAAAAAHEPTTLEPTTPAPSPTKHK